jgi:hypothetical protein
MLAAGWIQRPDAHLRSRLANVARYLAGLVIVSFVLNPFLWTDPIRAGLHSWQARGSLVQDQIQTQAVAQHVAVELPMNLSDRLSAFLGQVYFAPPQFQEAGNYQQALAPTFESYLDIPGHALFRGWLSGSVVFGLSLAGVLLALVQLRRTDREQRRRLVLLLIASSAIAIALFLGIPFPFQRYYAPMLPLTALWTAHAAGKLFELTKKLLSARAASL